MLNKYRIKKEKKKTSAIYGAIIKGRNVLIIELELSFFEFQTDFSNKNMFNDTVNLFLVFQISNSDESNLLLFLKLVFEVEQNKR